jgi:type II secretory pathway pseudopilin PulG
MAALLVAIALMSVFMSAAMPAWRHAAQREKEAELLWRGRQYDRALQLYRRKYGTPGPAKLDVLVSEKFLRKQYKDPITGGDFELRAVSPMGTQPGADAAEPEGRRTARARRRRRQEPESTSVRGPGQLIGGVRSRSKAKSIMVLNGRERYNEWDFTYQPYQDARIQKLGATPQDGSGVSPRSGRRPGRFSSPRSRQSAPRGSSPRGSGSRGADPRGSGRQR